MPNPIIQNYLNDDSVSPDKKKNVINDLNSGKPETEIAGDITSIYGDVYLPKSRQGAQGEMSVMEFLQKQEENPDFRLPMQKKQHNSPSSRGATAIPQNNLKTRVKDAIIGAKDAVKGGLDTIAGGAQNIQGSSQMMKQADMWKKQAEEQFAKDGDKAKFDKQMQIIGQFAGKAEDFRKLGTSQAFRGGVETAIGPITGGIEGAFKPEFQKLNEKSSELLAGMNDKNKKRLQKAVEAIQGLSKEHPVLTNYAAGLLELGGMGVGGKAVKETAKAGVSALKTGAEVAGGVASIVPDVVAGGAKLGTNLATKGVDKLKNVKNIKLPGKKNNIDQARELVSPEITKKNFQQAAAQGLASLGTKKLFSGSVDKIDLNNRLASAANTLATKIPNLNEVPITNLPQLIKGEIGKIGEQVRPIFKQTPVTKDVVSNVKSTWEKIKRDQAKDPDFSFAGVETMQKNFEQDFLPKLSQKFQDETGKFRTQNLDDMWKLIRGFDKTVPDRVKQAIEGIADARTLAQKEAWLRYRTLLRDAVDSLVQNVPDANVKQAFREMSDLYEAQTAILKNIKPTNKSGTSKIGELVDNYKKEAIGLAGLGTLYSVMKD